MALQQPVHGGLGRSPVGQVDDLVIDVERRTGPVEHHRRAAFTGHGLGHGQPEAGGATGDDDHAESTLSHHFLLRTRRDPVDRVITPCFDRSTAAGLLLHVLVLLLRLTLLEADEVRGQGQQ